jgi:hypothetical protein
MGIAGAHTAQIRTYLCSIQYRQNFFDEFAQTGQPLPPAARHVHVNLASRRFAGAWGTQTRNRQQSAHGKAFATD